MYFVGKIIGTHGIKGELKVKSDTSFDRFNVGNVLYIKIDENDYKKIVINSHRVHQGCDLITINNMFDINLVECFVGKEVYVKEHNREKDNVNLYYEDLIGCKAINEKGIELGEVKDLIEVPKGILLEIINGKKRSLVPYVKELVPNVDIKKKIITIHEIEGLIWK